MTAQEKRDMAQYLQHMKQNAAAALASGSRIPMERRMELSYREQFEHADSSIKKLHRQLPVQEPQEEDGPDMDR
jgi:hypothetical protein